MGVWATFLGHDIALQTWQSISSQVDGRVGCGVCPGGRVNVCRMRQLAFSTGVYTAAITADTQ